MLTILGAGFGLYGYLPALVGLRGQQVLLPARTRAQFDARAELRPFAQRIDWVADEDAALAAASGVVLALPPHVQPARTLDCLGRGNIGWLLLEKPLAVDPAAARALLNRLGVGGKRFRIGYLFRHTAWGRALLASRPFWPPGGGIAIRWCFMAHHFSQGRDTWKRRHAQGGGALRFFGIHLIALLAELGYNDVVQSTGWCRAPAEIERWQARFTGAALPDCEVTVNARQPTPSFTIERVRPVDAAPAKVDLQGPFDGCVPPPGLPGVDPRASLLAELFGSLDDDADYAWYSDAITLWQRAETIMALQSIQ
jgi:predicted dehydrogenase